MSHEEIAIALGISRNTLEKHFADQLATAAYQRRMEVLDAMHKAAKGGNVAAQKAYLSTSPWLSAPPAPAPAEAPAPKRGKKEQQADDAVTAAQGTGWDELLNGNKRPPLQ